ncbi:TSUP family transporter [Kribbella deserti]|uniref:Probable membrane transporter protein n=1 Tax=Kribbella deserti TaxID=1926257 RepID=A0ABV6QX82_9ACTN
MTDLIVVLLAGLLAGLLNAVGGGGTFVALPALVAAGMPSVTANAATTVALLPAATASVWVLRRDLTPLQKVPTRALTAISVLGGAAGAVLLLALPALAFDAVVPWLLAFATLVLAFGRRLTRLFRTSFSLSPGIMLTGQFVLALYGGYFGGAVGMLMVAFWTVGLGHELAALNPMRVAQLAAIYLTAAVIFLFGSDVVESPLLLGVLVVGAVAGGFGGGHVARRLPAWSLRVFVLTSAIVATTLYFVQGPG